MENRALAAKKLDARTTLIILAIVAVPAFFWFRFLYGQFVVDKVSPEMAKMRDGMMHPKPPAHASRGLAAKVTSADSGEKGETKHK